MKRNDMAAKREYLTDDCGSRTGEPVCLPKDAGLSQIFSELTAQLSSRYYIDKGVFVLREEGADALAAVSTWKEGQTRDGLSIRLPAESSLFEQVARLGQVYTEDFCGAFSGNFFERKLLIDDHSRSLVVQPLKFEGRVVGLLGYSSEEPTAFTMFEEGALEKVAGDFAEIIQERTRHH